MFPIELPDGTRIPVEALEFRTSRSSGPGGQNVNKLETRVEVFLQVIDAPWWSPEQRDLVMRRLGHRIDRSGRLRVTSQRHRSQWANRLEVIERLRELLAQALRPVTQRRSTKATRTSRERRLRGKRIASERKQSRRRPSAGQDE